LFSLPMTTTRVDKMRGRECNHTSSFDCSNVLALARASAANARVALPDQ
jgi:hypothetical protein